MKLMKQLLRTQTIAAFLLSLSTCPLIAADVTGDRLNIGLNHTFSGDLSSIAGGEANTLNAGKSFLGGGYENILSSEYCVLGGGYINVIDTDSISSFIGGGAQNYIQAIYGTIAGGAFSEVLAYGGGVLGGVLNIIHTNADYAVIG